MNASAWLKSTRCCTWNIQQIPDHVLLSVKNPVNDLCGKCEELKS